MPTHPEDVQAMISRLGSEQLLPSRWMDGDPTLACGGSWVFAKGQGHFNFGRPQIISLRDWSQQSVIKDLYYFQAALRLPDKTAINVCITRWAEKIRGDVLETFTIGEAKYTYFPVVAVNIHWTIEQINYSDYGNMSVEGLDIDDLDAISLFMQPAILQAVEADLSFCRRHSSVYGSVPITVTLHERWRDPRPELLELHGHFRRAREAFNLIVYDEPLLAKYKKEERRNGSVFLVADEPDTIIKLPGGQPEGPELTDGEVQLGPLSCYINAHPLSARNLSPPFAMQGGPILTGAH